MGGHTPGPWSTQTANDGSGDIGICAPNVGNVIAECFADMRYDGEQNYLECTANAHLIAAAPELLEALKDVLQIIEGVPAWNIEAAAGRAAIAKAEGRT